MMTEKRKNRKNGSQPKVLFCDLWPRNEKVWQFHHDFNGQNHHGYQFYRGIVKILWLMFDSVYREFFKAQ